MENAIIIGLFRDKIQPLVNFSDEEWNAVEGWLQIKKLKKNASFVESGKVCRQMGFIIRGGVRFCNFVDGQEVTGYFCFENNFFTAIKSYLTGLPCLYSIRALEETVFVSISKHNMQAMLKDPLVSSKIERLNRLIAENFNILFEDRLKSFIIQTPEERYRDLLTSGKEIVARMPVQYIAQFIGITPVSLSRIRKRILLAAADSK